MGQLPPWRRCAKCGRTVRRTWREYIVCSRCKREEELPPGWTRDLRRQAKLDQFAGQAPPPPAPFDNDDIPY